jgi:hypothetical protein
VNYWPAAVLLLSFGVVVVAVRERVCFRAPSSRPAEREACRPSENNGAQAKKAGRPSSSFPPPRRPPPPHNGRRRCPPARGIEHSAGAALPTGRYHFDLAGPLVVGGALVARWQAQKLGRRGRRARQTARKSAAFGPRRRSRQKQVAYLVANWARKIASGLPTARLLSLAPLASSCRLASQRRRGRRLVHLMKSLRAGVAAVVVAVERSDPIGGAAAGRSSYGSVRTADETAKPLECIHSGCCRSAIGRPTIQIGIHTHHADDLLPLGCSLVLACAIFDVVVDVCGAPTHNGSGRASIDFWPTTPRRTRSRSFASHKPV